MAEHAYEPTGAMPERCAGCYARTAGQRARLEPTLEARVAAWCAALVVIGEGRWSLCAEHTEVHDG